MSDNSFGKTKSARWLYRNANEQKPLVANIISELNEKTNFLRFLHEGVRHNTLISPYRKHVNRMIQDEYWFWKEVVREELTGRTSDVALSYVRQRFREFFS